MLFYGDRSRTIGPAARLTEIEGMLRAAQAAAGVDRQERLASAFLAGSELAQGLIDAEFDQTGADALTDLHRAALDYVRGLARALAAADASLAQPLGAGDLPATVQVKTPEGYGFYAVYPEAYRRAARAWDWASPPLAIGLRSIGVSLAAVVAEATGARDLVTVRPLGHPFARELRLAPSLAKRLAAHAGPFAIVDEGPGLSGSSFGAVADALERLGVEEERIVFLPSHAGDLGPQASSAHRARWARAQRIVLTLDDLLRADPIGGWFADLIGPADGVEDLSGGAWRAVVGDAPAAPGLERRKFRLTTAGGRWIARFAGLGETGAGKLAQAQALHAAGFGAQTLALRRGFLLQRWEDGERLDRAPFDRAAFLQRLAGYLAFRARSFRAAAEDGASPAALAEMARVNLGAEVSPPPWLGPPVRIDGRLQAWEWLQRADGRFVKLDALDHAGGHDLVGCQPIEWDVAGAEAEFGLSAGETAQLARAAAEAGVPIDAAALAFFRPCYAAFRAAWRVLADG